MSNKIKLTESQLGSVVKRIIKELNNPDKAEYGDVVTIYAEWNKDTGNFVRGGEWIGNPEYALGIVVLSSDYRGEIIRSCTLDGKRIPLPIRNYYNIQKGAGLAIIKKLNLK